MTRSNDASKPGSSFGRGLIITLLALILIGGIAFSLYTNQQLGDQLLALTTQTNTLKQQQADSKAQFDAALEALRSKQTKSSLRLTSLRKNLSSALQERWYQSNDWLLLKARYYLELAEINAHWSDNTQTTSALFQQADALLVNQHQPELFAVRQAIAGEIAQLQSIPVIDVAGILSQLDSAQNRVTDLPPKNPLTSTQTTHSTPKENTASTIWQKHLQTSLQVLEKLVIIRHHDDAIQPMLPPEYEAILRENIRLNLQEAQWAVIQRNPDVFKLTLNQAIENVKRGFDQNAESTQTLLKQLHDLQSIQFTSQQFTPGQSLPLLNQLIESRKMVAPVETKPVAVTTEPAPAKDSKKDPVSKTKPAVKGAKSS